MNVLVHLYGLVSFVSQNKILQTDFVAWKGHVFLGLLASCPPGQLCRAAIHHEWTGGPIS